ncbi:MAG: ATP-binding protein [Candidatus Eremiobacterota bacterium]
MIIVLFGLPGTGKTTVREELRKYLDFYCFSTDELRRDVLRDTSGTFTYEDTAPLTWEEILMAYRIVCYAAKPLIELNKNVLFDASFSAGVMRQYVKDLAKKTDIKIYFLEIICPEDIVKERLFRRLNDKTSESNAGWEVYKKVKKTFEPFEEEHFVIDTSKDVTLQIKEFLRKCHIPLFH